MGLHHEDQKVCAALKNKAIQMQMNLQQKSEWYYCIVNKLHTNYVMFFHVLSIHMYSV